MGRLTRLPRSRVPRWRLLILLTVLAAKPSDIKGSRGKSFAAPYVYQCKDETCEALRQFPNEPVEPKRLRCKKCQSPMRRIKPPE